MLLCFAMGDLCCESLLTIQGFEMDFKALQGKEISKEPNLPYLADLKLMANWTNPIYKYKSP